MSVSNGSRANQTTFNNAFLSRTTDSNTVGKVDLENVDAESGASIENVQRELNALNSFTGKTVNSDEDETPTWTSNDVGTSGDDLKDRAEALSAEFNATTGHAHSGVAGDGGPIDSANVSWDPVDTGYDADNVQDGIIAASDRIEFVFDIVSTHTTAIADIAGDLDDHINDAADAHDASAISNAPSGNLVATNVQTALNELQGDIDTIVSGGSVATHIADTTDAHDASAISNVASGNLAATDVQGALNELQTDVDTRATSAALSAHESDTSTHGVGVIVGTTETQTLSGKTFSDAITGAEIATPSNPAAGFNKLYFKSDDSLYMLNSAGTEVEVSGGGGGGGTITAWALDSDVSFGGAGTTTNHSVWSRRVGDSLEIRGHFDTGTVAASAAALIIGGSRDIDTAKMTSGSFKQVVGYWNYLGGGSTSINGGGAGASSQSPMIYDGSSTTQLQFTRSTGGSNNFSNENGSTVWGSSSTVAFFVTGIPIDGWS